jgi:glutamate--cysteine ligase
VSQDFLPDIILLNNDFSAGLPDILNKITQPILPAPALGWWNRTKTTHFRFYDEFAHLLGQALDIDPWLFSAFFDQSDHINFNTDDGIDDLMERTHHLLSRIKEKYDAYNISLPPFVVIKADAGTYGMAVMMVQEAQQLQNLNHKQRAHMSFSKGKQPVHHVILQEGVYSFETIGNPLAVTEPVVYAVGEHLIGGFHRAHRQRGMTENLNSPGMEFIPFAAPRNNSDNQNNSTRYFAYSVVARLALLALQKEAQMAQEYDDQGKNNGR